MRQLSVRLLLISCVSVCMTEGFGMLMPSAVFAGGVNTMSRFFAANDASYSGGRGLITLGGISGMFLYPTSGTLRESQLTVQYCVAIENAKDGTLVEHTAMLAYGLTDWIEIGALGRISDEPAPTPNIAASGPLFRVRVLKDLEWWPELSVGGIFREGNENLAKQTIFVAASKAVQIDADGFLRTFRLHGGFQQFWQDVRVNPGKPAKSASIGYLGGELEFPQHLYLVAEGSNNDVLPHIPFAIGLQWRHPAGYGLSLAGIQTGTEQGLYVGIGIAFR
jgi:hypothetical protein